MRVADELAARVAQLPPARRDAFFDACAARLRPVCDELDASPARDLDELAARSAWHAAYVAALRRAPDAVEACLRAAYLTERAGASWSGDLPAAVSAELPDDLEEARLMRADLERFSAGSA